MVLLPILHILEAANMHADLSTEFCISRGTGSKTTRVYTAEQMDIYCRKMWVSHNFVTDVLIIQPYMAAAASKSYMLLYRPMQT